MAKPMMMMAEDRRRMLELLDGESGYALAEQRTSGA
jgi:hypothetical protein